MKNKFSKVLIATIVYGSMANASYTTPSDAYKAAINNSTKITSSKYQFLSKEEGLNEVYGGLYPQLEASVSHSRTDYERNELINSSDPYVKENSTDLNVTLSQVIYDQSLLSKIDVEKSRVKISSYDFDMAKQEIAAETLNAYMSVLNSKNKISLLNTNLEYVSQNLNMIEKKYSMNLVTKMDYLKVNVEYQKSKIELIREEKNYEVMFKKLEDITKLKNIEIPNIDLDSLSDEYIYNLLEVVSNNTTLDKNINLLQTKTAVKMAAYDVSSARAGHLPTLGFNASYTKYISDDETSDYENYGSATLRFRIPLFNGWATSSRVQAKKLIKKAAIEDVKTIEDETQVKLNENTNKLKNEVETIKMYKEALISGETYLESIQLAYEKGLKSIVELYDAKNKLFEIKYDYIKSIHEMTNLYVEFLILTNNLDNLDLIDNIVSKKEQ